MPPLFLFSAAPSSARHAAGPPPVASLYLARSVRRYSTLLPHSAAAAGFRGLAVFGSASSDCSESSSDDTEYAALQRSLRKSTQMLPAASTLGCQHGVAKVIVGAVKG